ncbi:MAG: hypothetical protein AAFY60_16815, partial [Myxococcota bacterium]
FTGGLLVTQRDVTDNCGFGTPIVPALRFGISEQRRTSRVVSELRKTRRLVSPCQRHLVTPRAWLASNALWK